MASMARKPLARNEAICASVASIWNVVVMASPQCSQATATPSSDSMSARYGIDSSAPALVTDNAPAALPMRAASTSDAPDASAAHNAPQKASPAPTESTQVTA